MAKKRFQWKSAAARSVTEIIKTDGLFGTQDTLYIIDRLCHLLETNQDDEIIVHPENIFVDVWGNVSLKSSLNKPASMELYFPPEKPLYSTCSIDSKMYSMGIVMLYMVTGKEKKKDMYLESISPIIVSIIEKSTAFDPGDRFLNLKEFKTAVHPHSFTNILTLSKISFIFLFIIIVLAFTSLWFGAKQGENIGKESGYQSGFRDGFDQGYVDASGIGLKTAPVEEHSGNLPGNYICEGGPFAVYDGNTIYYLTDQKLYGMDPYTQTKESIVQIPEAYSLQYWNQYIYYIFENHVYQLNINNKQTKLICNANGMELYIFEDTLYLYDRDDTGYLYRIEHNRGILTQLNGAFSYQCLHVINGQLFYISPKEENCLCRSDLDGGNRTVISSDNYDSMCIYGQNIFAVSERGLIKMDLSGGNPEIILSYEVNDPNVSEDGIFYISRKDQSLQWVSMNGKYQYTVVKEPVKYFNVVGQWIVYEDTQDQLWCIHIGGSNPSLLKDEKNLA